MQGSTNTFEINLMERWNDITRHGRALFDWYLLYLIFGVIGGVVALVVLSITHRSRFELLGIDGAIIVSSLLLAGLLAHLRSRIRTPEATTEEPLAICGEMTAAQYGGATSASPLGTISVEWEAAMNIGQPVDSFWETLGEILQGMRSLILSLSRLGLLQIELSAKSNRYGHAAVTRRAVEHVQTYIRVVSDHLSKKSYHDEKLRLSLAEDTIHCLEMTYVAINRDDGESLRDLSVEILTLQEEMLAHLSRFLANEAARSSSQKRATQLLIYSYRLREKVLRALRLIFDR